MPKQKIRTSLMTLFLLATPIISIGGCAVSIGNVTCEFNVHSPHQSNGSKQKMLGKSDFKCDGTIDSARGEAKLQKLSANKWVDVPRSTDTREVKPVIADKKYTFYTGDQNCKPGTYRTAARGSGSLSGVLSKSSTWQYSKPNYISCKK